MITHDENFVNLIGRSEYATHYYRVDKVRGHTHDDTYDDTAASTGLLAPLHGSIRPPPTDQGTASYESSIAGVRRQRGAVLGHQEGEHCHLRLSSEHVDTDGWRERRDDGRPGRAR